ncbi:MAG: DUF4177 domain-containing protein [Chloroflexi bacterium]|nr:DUF4177 domain-containing protein [Chloroflexota bacterium]
MTKWEYRVLVFKSGWGARLKEEHEEVLNALGQEGWELAGRAAESTVMSLVFKRPVGKHKPSRHVEQGWPSW